MYGILLILYQTVSLSLVGSTFLLLLQLTAPQTHRKILPSSDLFDEKTKTCLMRILQRRARYPALITSYWDHSTRRAQLCFSYAPSSQPTFDSYSQDCLLSCCVLIRGFTAPECLSIHKSGEKVRLHSRLFETLVSHFAGAWRQQRTFKRKLRLYPTETSFLTLTWAVFGFVSHIWPFNVQFIWYYVYATGAGINESPLSSPGRRTLPDLEDQDHCWDSIQPVSLDCS